jgi:hypothetical protein
MAKKIVTKAAKAPTKQRSMLVTYNFFPGFRCHPLGKIIRKKGQMRYQYGDTDAYWHQDAVLNVITREQGDQITAMIEKAQAARSAAFDDLTKGMEARLETEVQELLLAGKLAPPTGFNIG